MHSIESLHVAIVSQLHYSVALSLVDAGAQRSVASVAPHATIDVDREVVAVKYQRQGLISIEAADS